MQKRDIRALAIVLSLAAAALLPLRAAEAADSGTLVYADDILLSALISNNNTNGASSRMSYDVSGATTSSATDDRGSLLQNEPARDARYATLELQAFTPGSNTCTSKYRVSSGTGSFSARTMIVMAL